MDGKQYLVTARHIVVDLQPDGNIQVFSNGAWVPLPVQLVGHASGDVDISVMAPGRLLTPPNLPMEPISERARITYGQDVYFLGFPYGFLGEYIFGPNGYPMPFVKKAIVSLFDGPVFLLDGHNNPGFSGGPVVFTEPGANEFKVAAVISGYQAVREPVYEGAVETTLTFQHNTGIIVTYAINPALELIRENPIGIGVERTGTGVRLE